jgi:quinol monooxygenase YgiN
MTVRILIERTAEPDRQDELLDLMRQLRAKTMLRPGYISGE